MKAILMSIQPKWVAKILNKEKLLEIRKRFPIDYRGWVYIYVTKNEYLYSTNKGYIVSKEKLQVRRGYKCEDAYSYEGKVVARFWCDKVEEISYNYRSDFTSVYTDTLDTEDLEKQACLTKYEFAKYLQGNNGYAIHISQLEIFDRPRELWEFCKIGCLEKAKNYIETCSLEKLFQKEMPNEFKQYILSKAPQSWQFIEVEE